MSRRKPPTAAAQRAALIEEHMPFARMVAVSIKAKLPPFISLDDLISEAYVGLVQAGKKYKLRSKVPFRAFAYRRIHGQVMESVRRKNFRHTSTAQLCEHEDRLRALISEEIIPVEEELHRMRIAEMLRAVVESLPETAQTVIGLRYWKGLNGKAAGRALGIGESRSSQLHQQTLEALRKRIHDSMFKKDFAA